MTLKLDQILVLTAVQMETRAIRQAIPAIKVHTAGIRAGHLPGRDQLAGISLIVMTGVAGALDPTLKIGDVVIDDPDHRIADHSIYRRGRIHTASEIITSPEQKSQLFKDTGALAVDMEQQIVRDFLKPLNIPVIGVRAISDTAHQILDPAVVHLVDNLGRPRFVNIATTLVRRPMLVPYLARLNANTKVALENLSRALCSVISHL